MPALFFEVGMFTFVSRVAMFFSNFQFTRSVERITGNRERPRLEQFDAYFHVNIHAVKEGHERFDPIEIHCLVGDNWVVTAHSDTFDLLGEFNFSGIRPDVRGKVQVEITFDVNIEGILTMRARDPESGKEMKTEVRVSQQ